MDTGGTLTLAGPWSNAGAITVTGGTLNLGGTFSALTTGAGTFNRTGSVGTVNLTGTFNNTGNTFVFNTATGVINLAGGTIIGGTLQAAGGNLVMTASSTLNNVTLDMDFTVTNGTQLFLTGTALTIAATRTLHLVSSSSGSPMWW